MGKTDNKWPCHPDLPTVFEGDYIPVIGILYYAHNVTQARKACSAAESALTFHGANTKLPPAASTTMPNEIGKLLELDPSVRLLRAGESCQAKKEKGIIPLRFLPRHGRLPEDAPPGFSFAVGLTKDNPKDQKYVRGFFDINTPTLIAVDKQDMVKKDEEHGKFVAKASR